MLFVCADPEFSIASAAAAASISHRTYFDERNVRQAGQAVQPGLKIRCDNPAEP
jgi:hypothetical protein